MIETCPQPKVRPSSARRALPAAVGALAIATFVSGCHSSTEIVLVIDTNLSVPVDIDRVDIAIAGADMQSTNVGLDLTAATPFPLTLGLTPSGTPGSVSVSVIGSVETKAVVEQDSTTAFVDGSTRVLRMLLLDACIGITCPAGETCGFSGCASTVAPGASLPPWTGTTPTRPPPDKATTIEGRTVWANGWHSCATEGETLYCWGQNSDGEIGDGATTNASVRRPVMGIQNPVSIGLGQFVTCICDGSGSAWCWGRNVEGELGIGKLSPTATAPTQVPGVIDCAHIAGGAQHTCMIRSGGTVACWGSNANGQIGQSTASTSVAPSPIDVANLTDVAQVAAGEQYTCVRKTDMTVECWGDNSSGQLGDGTTVSRPTPAVVTGLGADVVEIAAGRFFACARHATGTVSCWGSNAGGQLGNGTTTDSSLPVEVPGVMDATQLAAGLIHACVLRSTGTVSCWGGNMNGQLGDGTIVYSSAPVDVVDIAPVTSIAAGSVHTCARYLGGVACWGQNVVNQLGDGTTTQRLMPVSVAGFL